jgi:hypothetical protein
MPLIRTSDIIYSDIPLQEAHKVGLSTKKDKELLYLVKQSVDYIACKKQVKGIVLQTADKKTMLSVTTKKLCDYILLTKGIDQTIAKNCAKKNICVLFSIQSLKDSLQNPPEWSQVILDLYVCITCGAPYSFVSLSNSSQSSVPFVQRQAIARVFESYARELSKNL